MSKRTSYEIKKQILLRVKEKGATYAELERSVNTGYRTIKANCEELEEYEFVEINDKNKHPTNNKPYHIVRITEKGIKNLKKK